MDDQSVIAAQDGQRTKRLFLSFVSDLVGGDQSLAGADGQAVNPPRQYQSVGPDGAIGIEGTSVSNRQGGGVTLSAGMLLLIGVGLYFYLQKG